MNHEKVIQKIEELSINALPSLRTQLVDGWLLRFSNGYSKRANSINPLYTSNDQINKKIEKIGQIYRNKRLNAIYKLTPHVFPKNLDDVLAQAGYNVEGTTSVQLLSLYEFSETPSLSHNIVIYNSLEDTWLTSFCKLNNVCEADMITLRDMLESIVPDVCYVLLLNEKEEIVACGLGVLEDHYIGLFDIVTHPHHRNKGYARQVILNILNWGKTNGAKHAYLQVVPNNDPAINLYSKLGFKEAYKYWYRIKS